MSPIVATQAESQWVQAELIRSLMATASSTQYIGLMLIPIYVAVLWTDATMPVLSLWAGFAVAVAAVRLWVLYRYARHVKRTPPAEQLTFFHRWRYIWLASALVWGLSPLLYFDRSPLADQFICWLIMAGVAMFSINSFSSQLQTMTAYLNVMGLTTLAVMLWRIGVELGFQGPLYHYWLVGLLVVFWQLLRQAGFRLHMTHRKNFELQYRNNQLIESLRRQTQAALDAVEIKNRFLASAAHDIRQPVHALGLYADWLGSEPELVNEIAPKIVESTKAVNALFDSLFDLVRLDSGKTKLNFETVDLGELLHNLELQYRPLAQAKGLEFRVHVTPGTVASDPILLQRIVGNLISNAVRYTRAGGVLVASRVSRRGMRIEVWDTGVGIAPVHQSEIFREFYKVQSHPGTEDGFGLGLYIVARLTSILGYPLTMCSRPGYGTMFRLVLVQSTETEAQERATASAGAQLVNRP